MKLEFKILHVHIVLIKKKKHLLPISIYSFSLINLFKILSVY